MSWLPLWRGNGAIVGARREILKDILFDQILVPEAQRIPPVIPVRVGGMNTWKGQLQKQAFFSHWAFLLPLI